MTEEKQIFLSTDMAHRLAAIDIGSNSVRLVVAEPLRGGSYRILDEEREATRLGRTLSTSGTLDPAAVEATLAALRRFKQIAAGFQCSEMRVIATAAVRESSDREEFCRRAKEDIGLDVEVISGEQEGRLAFYSVQRAFDLSNKNVVIADIGGGSTEFIFASGNLIEAIYTSPLGAVRMTDFYGKPDGSPLANDDLHKLAKGIDRELRKHTKRPYFAPHLLIGSGGTFTSIAEMIMAQKGQVGLPVRGYMVNHAEVSHLLGRLAKLPLKARRGVPGLSPDRADIIIAGLSIVDRIMRRFRINALQIHSRGVRDGLLLTMIDQTLGNLNEDPHNREQAIERFAVACSGELAHGRQVAQLAAMLHTELAGELGLDPEDRPLLEAAARLQDVGYLINYDKHHKHSYHLILNSRLAGFSPRELEIVANVARYHRGSDPKLKHDNFRQLSLDDQRRVRQLAAILRVAGGLDRSHSQQVQAVRAKVKDKTVELEVFSAAEPDVDLWGARRRAKLFERVFHSELDVFWAGAGKTAAPSSKTISLAAQTSGSGEAHAESETAESA